VRILDAITSAGLLVQNQDTQTGAKRSLMDDPARIADLEHAVLTRGQTTISVDLTALLRGDTSQNLALQPGDVFTIPRRPSVRVYALGEFRTAGRLNLPDGAAVLDLLNAAGGTTQNAQPSDAALLRIVEGKPTSLPVDVGRLLSKGDLSQNVTLKEGDVLYVPARGESNQSAWRLLSILPLVF
jgi:polysaccharide export outer membrane protein